MKTDTSTQEYAEMARQAQELEAACANAKPERLPRHELALYLMNNKFAASRSAPQSADFNTSVE